MQEFMLIYKGGDPEWMRNASQDEIAASMARWGAWMGALQAKDQLASGGSPLEFSGKRLTKDGIITDIVSFEFKELVTGFSIIRAKDIDAALAIAKECPVFNHSGISIEIRAIMSIDCS